jgi:hypothetical protein
VILSAGDLTDGVARPLSQTGKTFGAGGPGRYAGGVTRGVVVAQALLLLVAVDPPAPSAQGTKQIKVVFEVRQAGSQSRDAVQGGGRVIITERGSARASGRLGVESTQQTVTRSTGIFTIVPDGGESMLLVASQVPYAQAVYYRDYLTGAGHLTTGVSVRDVGTSLKVRATVLPGNQIRVRMTPTLSWFAAERSGVIEAIEASTEVVVPHNRPVVVGGATSQVSELTRQILGLAAGQSASETRLTLRATLLE